MKIKLTILSLLTLLPQLIISQINFKYSENFTAVCGYEGFDIYGSPDEPYVYVSNDSIHILDAFESQCCPKFAFQISDITNDSIYVTLTDTAYLACPCTCNWGVTMNIGKASSKELKISYKGNWYSIVPDDYKPFIVDSKKYTNVTSCIFGQGTFITEFVMERDGEDSNMVDNYFSRSYYPYRNSEEYFYEVNGKVFFVDYIRSILVYDFMLSTGDSVEVGDPDIHSYKLIVDSVKYLDYGDNELRKTLYLGIEGSYTFSIWVEGIGDLHDPLGYWQDIILNGCSSAFACCSVDGRLLYRSPYYPDCGLFSSVDATSVNDFKISPNPAVDRIFVEGNLNGQMNYQILTMEGFVEMEGALESVISLNLCSGVYLFVLKENNKVIKTEKLVVDCH